MAIFDESLPWSSILRCWNDQEQMERHEVLVRQTSNLSRLYRKIKGAGPSIVDKLRERLDENEESLWKRPQPPAWMITEYAALLNLVKRWESLPRWLQAEIVESELGW